MPRPPHTYPCTATGAVLTRRGADSLRVALGTHALGFWETNREKGLGALKVCRHCGQRKKAGEFRRSRQNRDGLSSWCAECHNEANRRWRDANRERMNEARRVVPRFVYDPERKTYVPNPDPRAKSKVR